MKSLDEVIKAGDILGRYVITDNATGEDTICDIVKKGFISDALFYLKEYQRYQNTPSRIGHMAMVDLEDNPPLTWDELRTTEGKPVWVELPKSSRKAWGLNDGIFVDAFRHEIITIKILHDLWHLDKEQMGQTWQAYRKER